MRFKALSDMYTTESQREQQSVNVTSHWPYYTDLQFLETTMKASKLPSPGSLATNSMGDDFDKDYLRDYAVGDEDDFEDGGTIDDGCSPATSAGKKKQPDEIIEIFSSGEDDETDKGAQQIHQKTDDKSKRACKITSTFRKLATKRSLMSRVQNCKFKAAIASLEPESLDSNDSDTWAFLPKKKLRKTLPTLSSTPRNIISRALVLPDSAKSPASPSAVDLTQQPLMTLAYCYSKVPEDAKMKFISKVLTLTEALSKKKK